jgi:hypothetical protein
MSATKILKYRLRDQIQAELTDAANKPGAA